MAKVVVIGGNAAGLSAASQVKRQKPDWEVIVLEKGKYVSYAACGMPYFIGGVIAEFGKLLELTSEEVRERNIDLRVGYEVLHVDAERKELEIKTPAGLSREQFDFLVIASGAVPAAGEVNFASSERVFTLKNLEDMESIMSFIRSETPKTCAVIGAGSIALEMLEAFRVSGLHTHMIHRRSDLAKIFEKEVSDLIKDRMVREGVVLNLNRIVHSVEQKDTTVVVKTDAGDLFYDFVLVATGVLPNTSFLRGSGIELGVKQAIRVNSRLQTNFPYIFAAGDCAETTNIITGEPAHVPLALKANREGYIAGVNICGGNEEFPGVLGTAILKVFDLGIARTGLGFDEAAKAGLSPVKFQISSQSKARYYPGAETLHSVIIIGKNDGRILGAQLAGPLDAVKRIDVYAVMIHNKMTVSEAFNLDVAYAPPFSPVFDPVVLAARVGKKYVK